MRRLLIALVIGVIAWQAWGAYQARQDDEEYIDDSESSVLGSEPGPELSLEERGEACAHCSLEDHADHVRADGAVLEH